jgi:glycine/D-amino acid oxidase-like deaminating enzyme/nitrite reductase/ring-hydroxylating ferredoxin subunit
MPETTSGARSLWLATSPATTYPSLAQDLDVDVAVIGGGVAGLSTALMLRRDGATVAVVEAARVGRGVTGCTTAKVSALQSTILSTIRKRHGEETASVYADASRAGVERVASLVAELSLDCELERRPALTYAAQTAERPMVEAEADAATRAGLPVEFVETSDLPYPIHGAARLADQLQFHPVRYAQGLAAAIATDGSHVFETTRVLGVDEGKPCRVRTSTGEIRARQVVIATHYPILDRGLYFARMKAQRSYCIAARLAGGPPPSGMAISAGSPTRSVRSFGDILIVGGEGHPTGSGEANETRYQRLAEFARTYWDVESITHQWSAQDPVHYDHLPVIGPYRPGSARLWVTSGFMKWGLATATFGAEILADRIAGRDNQWAATFSPNRMSPRSVHEVAGIGAKFTADLVGDRIRRPQVGSSTEIAPGQARVVRDARGRKGVYRDEAQNLHAVSLRCPHMGCLLRFNAAETSWDCPCHGSRFDVDGTVLEGPAVRDLERREP